MRLIFYILIPSLIASFVVTCHANDDPCARIINEFKQSNKDPEFSSKYSDVIACYESFPYERKLAEKTIETIKKTLQGFYVFLSEAKEEPEQGFSFRAVDLIKELDSLLSKDYKTDYQFTTDVRKLIIELKDPHLKFTSACYKAFEFSQQLSLYSVINKDDVQIIKIFDDRVDDSSIDCEVTHIDGRPSMEVINEFADMSSISRDAGVRFNSVLTGLGFNESGKLIEMPLKETFTFRVERIPEKSSVEYTLVCANNTSTTFTREWKITSPFYNAFETSKDYWETLCLSTNTSSPAPIDREDEPKIYSMRECEMVHQTLIAKFFILSDEKTGVVVITSENLIFTDELFELQHGFSLLEDRGVQKLVLDLSYNPGGSVELALFIVYLLFPNFEPSFDIDMVVTELSRAAFIQATSKSKLGHFGDLSKIPPPPSNLTSKGLMIWAADAAFAVTSSDSIFNAFGYKNPKTRDHFHTVEEFIGNNTYIRGGIPTHFTSKFIYRYAERVNIFIKLISGNVKTYKWKSEDMIILTNGFCGSSCSTITQRMAERYNVSTVAVGGYKDIPLSYASFPGGQVFKLDDLIAELEDIGVLQNDSFADLIPSPFLIRANLTFTIKELYDVEHVLEFAYKPAKHRLYYDELSARDRSILWLEVVKNFLT